MELIAVLVMIVIGGAGAVFVLIALAIAKGDAKAEVRSSAREHGAAPVLFPRLRAGGPPPEAPLRCAPPAPPLPSAEAPSLLGRRLFDFIQ